MPSSRACPLPPTPAGVPLLSHNPQLICACRPPCIAGQKKDRKERKADRKERLAARKAERTGLSKQARREWEWLGLGQASAGWCLLGATICFPVFENWLVASSLSWSLLCLSACLPAHAAGHHC